MMMMVCARGEHRNVKLYNFPFAQRRIIAGLKAATTYNDTTRIVRTHKTYPQTPSPLPPQPFHRSAHAHHNKFAAYIFYDNQPVVVVVVVDDPPLLATNNSTTMR